MKTFIFSIFFIGSFVNAQFTYPDPKIADPVEDLEEKDELINLIINNQKIKEFYKKSQGAENETNIEIKKFDIQGNILFASDMTQIPSRQFTRKDEYKTVLSGDKIVAFEKSSLDAPTSKTEIFYDVKNQVSKITGNGAAYEYIYEKGRLIKKIEKYDGEKIVSAYQYNPAGKVTAIYDESVSPKKTSSTLTNSYAYDPSGNILSNSLNSTGSVIEKKYVYTDHLLTKYTLIFKGNKTEEKQYEYDQDGRVIKMVKASYNPYKNSSSSTSSLVFKYAYKNGLLAERSTLFNGQEPAYIETFFYDDQQRMIKVKTQSENKVVANVSISYGNKTITLTGDTYQSDYTLYE